MKGRHSLTGCGKEERMHANKMAGPLQRDQANARAHQQQKTIPAVDRGASTIDALFAPIEVIETTGQVWLLSNDVLTPISITLGASDGTSSELVTDQTTGRALINGSILVTNITTPATSPVRTTGGNTSPLMPQFPFGRRPSNNSGNRR